MFDLAEIRLGPGGEIGRRKGLKIPRWKHRAGSSPALGTILDFLILQTLCIVISHISEIFSQILPVRPLRGYCS